MRDDMLVNCAFSEPGGMPGPISNCLQRHYGSSPVFAEWHLITHASREVYPSQPLAALVQFRGDLTSCILRPDLVYDSLLATAS